MNRCVGPLVIALLGTACATTTTSPASREASAASADGSLAVAETASPAGAPPAAEPSSSASPKAIVCRKERRTGTHRVDMVCRSRSEMERSAAAAKERLRKASRTQEDYN